MNGRFKRLVMTAVFLSLMILALPDFASANSAEPPSLVIIVQNPPEDLSIALSSEDDMPKATVRHVAWEGYFVFYSRDMRYDGDYIFIVTVDGESFECTLDGPLEGYNNVATLDIKNRELVSGKQPFRSALLVSIRVMLTLIIEGLVFFAFGFRQRRSWLVFLAVNIVTQGVLNIWLSMNASPIQGYLIFSLILGEVFVFAFEMLAFPAFIREHNKSRAVLFALAANMLSLIAGGYIISVLPV